MQKKNYLDYLNVFACFCVLWNHVAGRFFFFDHGKSWILSVIIHVIVDCGVPIFAMITGATLLDYRERYTTAVFFKKRILKVVIPFLAWELFYMVLEIRKGNFEYSFKGMITGIMENQFVTIFWFFFPLFGAYLAMPVLSSIEKEKRKEVLQYCILAYLILGQILPCVFQKLEIAYNIELQFNIISGFLFYVIVGFYIDNYQTGRRLRHILFLMGGVCLIYNIFDCIILSYINNDVTRTFAGCFSLTYMITDIAVFVLVRYLLKNIKTSVIIDFIRPYTFGIYLIQFLILQIIEKMSFINTYSWVYISVGVIPVFILCLFICAIMKKIPIIRHFL